jgi:hypothetical protein
MYQIRYFIHFPDLYPDAKAKILLGVVEQDLDKVV